MARLSAKPLFGLRTKVFYGWWIVAIGLFVDAFKHGTFNRGFSLYVLPIRNELGIGVAAIALADMLGRLEGGIMGPVVGYCTDRFGPGVMLAFGGIMSGVGFILLSLTNNLFFFTLIFVGFLSVGFRSGYNNASIPAANQWFRRKRGLAMSIISAGSGLGGVVVVPVIGLLVFSVGWRTAALVSGIAIIVAVVPLSFLMKKSPEGMGLYPDGIEPEPTTDASAGEAAVQVPSSLEAVEQDYTAKEAMKTPTFWMLTMASGFRNTVHSGIMFLMAPVMVWFLMGSGRTEEEGLPIAALFIGVLSGSTLVFNLIIGYMGDRVSKTKLSAICMIGGTFSMLVLLNQSGHLWQLLLFVGLLAFAESVNPLTWAIMGEFFGRKSFATLRGWQHVPNQFMSMSTPVWMGWIFDNTESYFWSLIPLAAIYGIAGIFFYTMPRPKSSYGQADRQG
jgi:MCP family monocarboxylic acid transporter-like MFS transporter 13